MKKNKYSGSSFDDFLKDEGIYEEVKTLAQKELAAERYKRYPIVIYKDLNSNYSMTVPDLPDVRRRHHCRCPATSHRSHRVAP